MSRRSSAKKNLLSLPLVFDLPDVANSSKVLVSDTENLQQVVTPDTAKNEFSHRLNDAPEKLWLCLYLPKFSLEFFSIDDTNKATEKTARVVIYESSGQWRVRMACRQARQLGIESGMALTAAYALCPDLTTFPQDEQEQLSELNKIADWAYQFTPVVSLFSTNGVLLEVYHSLALFGGLLRMLKKITEGFSAQWSYSLQYAAAPTPRAAGLLAKIADTRIIEARSDLRSKLAMVEIFDAFSDEPKLCKKLHNLGLKNLQDLWRLPRAGLARRYGKSLLQGLDKLLGDAPDPLPLHQPPVSFDVCIELAIELSNKKTLLFSAEKLMIQLQRFLQKHDAGITQFFMRFYFFDHPPVNINLSLRQCSRDAKHILGLLDERIERLQLPGPASEIRLMVKELIPFVAQPQALFSLATLEDNYQSSDPDWDNLLEQIQNRLGKSAVQYLQLLNDHRPEYAWRYQHQFDSVKHELIPLNPRPLWLLFSPQRLLLRQGKPWYGSVLSVLFGPERIDAGWYSDQSVARDYYMVSDRESRRLWIFRDLKSKHWFLHGCF